MTAERATMTTSKSSPHRPQIVVFGMVTTWYASNIGVLLLNKYLLTSAGFRSPVFLTLCHMLSCVCLGALLSLSRIIPAKQLKSRLQFVKICSLASIFCLSVVCGNISLEYIPVSFNQAIGSTTPVFTALFAFAFQGARESPFAYAALIPVVGGIVIASGGEPLFHIVGFTACVLAAAGRALKSVVQSMLMTDPSEKLDAMSLLLYMSAVSTVLLAPVALYLEPDCIQEVWQLSSNSAFITCLLLNSLMAYLVNLTNFLVTKYTSPLTLQVLGNAKGVVAAIISVMVFANPVTWTGIIGYATTMLGVVLYSDAKSRFPVEKAGYEPVAQKAIGNIVNEGASPRHRGQSPRNAHTQSPRLMPASSKELKINAASLDSFIRQAQIS